MKSGYFRGVEIILYQGGFVSDPEGEVEFMVNILINIIKKSVFTTKQLNLSI